jgi:hypothetical protein
MTARSVNKEGHIDFSYDVGGWRVTGDEFGENAVYISFNNGKGSLDSSYYLVANFWIEDL